MKSALELAMEKSEKLGGAKKLTKNQKNQIAEIRKVNGAKIAELTIMANEKLEKLDWAGEEHEAVRDELTQNMSREKAKIEEATERKIEKIRSEK